MDGAIWGLAGAVSVLGTHLAMSHPLRRPLVARLGEGGFTGLYSLVSFITLGITIWAYVAAPVTMAGRRWPMACLDGSNAGRLNLLMGSLIRNPALPGAAKQAATAQALSVYGITRHPMLWSFAIWGCSHILVLPIAKNIGLSGAIIFLSLVRAVFQDRKKAQLDPQGWSAWQSRTSHLPFAAIAQGRARFGSFGLHAILGGIIVWLAATWAHIPLAGWPAGIWRGWGRSFLKLDPFRERQELRCVDAGVVRVCNLSDAAVGLGITLPSAQNSTSSGGRGPAIGATPARQRVVTTPLPGKALAVATSTISEPRRRRIASQFRLGEDCSYPKPTSCPGRVYRQQMNDCTRRHDLPGSAGCYQIDREHRGCSWSRLSRHARLGSRRNSYQRCHLRQRLNGVDSRPSCLW